MTDWTEGYVCDLEYTRGFYREQVPSWLAFCLLLRGIRTPDGPYSYCELGCGHGYTANVIAAANPGARLLANDFNPSHTVSAHSLASDGGLGNVEFTDASFAELLERDLPGFDFITLHGVYSWVSPANRAVIVEFLRRHLNPGGVVYISYNCLPGWSANQPLRQIMVEHSRTTTGPVAGRIDKALVFAKQVAQLGAGYFANPQAAARLDQLQPMSRHYLAHEYFNRDWAPLCSSDVARDLAAAKLTFAGSATVSDYIDGVNLSQPAQDLLAEIPDETLRQTVRDYLVNIPFRKDIFVRGAVPLAAQERMELLNGTRFALIAPQASIPAKSQFPMGEVDLRHASIAPVVAALASGPASLAELAEHDDVRQLGFAATLQAIKLLMAAAAVSPCLPVGGQDVRARSAAAFNDAVLERARFQPDLTFLASPVTGGGVELGRIDQLVLLAERRGVAPAEFLKPILAQGQGLLKDGKVLQTLDENLAHLENHVANFRRQLRPMLERLGIV